MRVSLLILVAAFFLSACDPIALTRYSFVIRPQGDSNCNSVAFQTTYTSEISKLIVEIVKKHGARHFNEPNEMSNVIEKPDQGLVILTLREFGRFSSSETTRIVMNDIIEHVKKEYGDRVIIIQGEVTPNPSFKRDCPTAAP